MNYKETIDYLFSQLPMFQRIGAAAYKADLSNTLSICKLLKNPENDFPAVHIAGTNGKGSTANMVASVLQEAGYKTGLFTSPHLIDFRERIRVNGEMVSKDFVVDFVRIYGKESTELGASFFELTFGLAMKYFSEQNVDIAVVEVGMGGRLDSSNVVNPMVSVITNISFDHTAFLGNTLEEIAGEKAGIMKPNVPVVIGRNQPETKDVFLHMAEKKRTKICYADDIVDIKLSALNEIVSYAISNDTYIDIEFPLKGFYQAENLKTALAALYLLSLNEEFSRAIDSNFVSHGLKNIYQNTHFSGRWQMLSQTPLTICDTGHNVDGLAQTMAQLSNYKYEKLHMVVGMVNDKNIDEALQLMPKEAQYYFCKANIPRGLPAEEMASKAAQYGLNGKSYHSVNEAYKAAQLNASIKDIIFIGGSTFVVAEVV